ncbi:MAG: translation initiation factor IF-3 [Phycisphaerae bacterium]|nr:translation initiation factor IF-3 [Phycisphaerae bacterium]
MTILSPTFIRRSKPKAAIASPTEYRRKKIARPFRRDTRNNNELRRNDRIRVSPVRLIDQNEGQVGVVSLSEAQAMAREAGLDLVEVVPNATPPVCRILDYGKYKYDLAKKQRHAKAHRHETELKEIRIRTPKIDTHDLMIKVNRAREFLLRGDRVQFSLRFRGRELAHIDEGQRIFTQIEEALQDCGKVDRNRREGRRITMLIAPLTKQQILQKRQAANLAAKIARGEIPAPTETPPATETDAAPAPPTPAAEPPPDTPPPTA